MIERFAAHGQPHRFMGQVHFISSLTPGSFRP
jgi:hypothetical protein